MSAGELLRDLQASLGPCLKLDVGIDADAPELSIRVEDGPPQPGAGYDSQHNAAALAPPQAVPARTEQNACRLQHCLAGCLVHCEHTANLTFGPIS